MEFSEQLLPQFLVFIKDLNQYLSTERKVILSDLSYLEKYFSRKKLNMLSGRLSLTFTSEVKEKDGSVTKFIEIHVFREDGFLIKSNRDGEYDQDHLQFLVDREEKDLEMVPGYMKESFDTVWKILKEHKGTIEVATDKFKVERKHDNQNKI
jgi:hypothetical protein